MSEIETVINKKPKQEDTLKEGMKPRPYQDGAENDEATSDRLPYTSKSNADDPVSDTSKTVKNSIEKMLGVDKSLNKRKQKGNSKAADTGDKTSDNKQPSKLATIVYLIKMRIRQFVKLTLAVSKEIAYRSYSFLKDKEIVANIKKNKPITFSLFGVLIILLIALFVFSFSGYHPKTKYGPDPRSNLTKINSIQAELSSIQATVTSTSQMNQQEKQALENKLQAINTKLAKISNPNPAVQHRQIKDLQATLQSNNVNLSQKIAALNKEINQIKMKVFPQSTLSTKALPFKVVSVDPWNGEPYAELQQRHNSTMMTYAGLYQTVGGWKVIKINAPEQTVTFVNAQGQMVHVHVKPF